MLQPSIAVELWRQLSLMRIATGSTVTLFFACGCATTYELPSCRGSIEEGFFTAACHYGSNLQPCKLESEAVETALENIETYLQEETGDAYVHYQGTVSEVASDIGTQCRFYASGEKVGPDGSYLLHGELFVFIEKATLLPVASARIVW